MKIDTKSLLIGIILTVGIVVLYLELTNSKNQIELPKGVNEIGRYVPFGEKNTGILDTKTGEVWSNGYQDGP